MTRQTKGGRSYRARRSRGQVGGAVRLEGDPRLCRLIRTVLTDLSVRHADDLTHGFHTYPAGMHPAIAAHVVQALGTGAILLDPFCGGGTTVIEGLVAGARATGVDLNPLAVRVAEVRTQVRGAPARKRFAEALERVVERSLQRVRDRQPARAPIPRSEARWYDGHVLKELAGLREEALSIKSAPDRRALEVVLSSIVVKVSRQRGDTSERVAAKRVRKGLATELFARKGQELLGRWEELAAHVPEGTPKARLEEGDARALDRVLGAHYRANLIVTSPPYGGTYDYAAHHRRRYPWLGIRPGRLERSEIGARRNLGAGDAAARWDRELLAALRSMGRVLSSDGLAVVLMGDAQLGRRARVSALEQLGRLAPDAQLRVRAAGSQRRPDWTGGEPRLEHLVVLSRG